METKKMMKECLQYIEQNLAEISTVAEIAHAMGYSEFHFSRRFRQEMQMSVMEYVKKRRLIRASDAILNGEKIIDVALRFGWQTHGGFTKSFKQEFGFCPALLKAIIMELESIGGSAMSHVFYTKTELHATKEELIELLKKEIIAASVEADLDELDRICASACEVYHGLTRYSGDEYVTHPLNVAILLAQMGADINTIYAGIFWNSLWETELAKKDLEKILPMKTIKILDKLENRCEDDALEEDEVIIVRLADRLHNMRTLGFLDEEKAKKRAQETLDLFLPLAKKIGNVKLVNELNDLSLKYLCEKNGY